MLANADVIGSLRGSCCSSGAIMQLLRGQFCQLACRDAKLPLGGLNLHVVPLERSPLASSILTKLTLVLGFQFESAPQQMIEADSKDN